MILIFHFFRIHTLLSIFGAWQLRSSPKSQLVNLRRYKILFLGKEKRAFRNRKPFRLAHKYVLKEFLCGISSRVKVRRIALACFGETELLRKVLFSGKRGKSRS